MSIVSKVVVITGASSGIGEALAREYVRRGASVALLGRRKDLLQQLADELRGQAGKARAYVCDVTQENELDSVLLSVKQDFGSIDTVIANAGFGVAGNFEALKLEDYRRQFETNVFGVLRTVYAALPELKLSKGRVAILGSVAGYIALPQSSAYAMSKFAVRAFAQSLRGELRGYGISVTLISPGFVKSQIRLVDNQGKFNQQAREPMPNWLVKSTESAAVEMVQAIEARKSERIITLHGKVLIGIQRFVPWVLVAAQRWTGLRGRREAQ